MMKERGKRILLVEEDKNLGQVIKNYLAQGGYEVTLKDNGLEGLKDFMEKKFDLCLFNILLPSGNDLMLADEVRQQDPFVPVMFFSSTSMTPCNIGSFSNPEDEKAKQCFTTEEVLMRLQTLLPEVSTETRKRRPEQYAIGRYHFQYDNHLLRLGSKQIILSKKECELLRLLCARKNQLVKRDEALTLIWGENTHANGRSMDVFISKLRKHLQNDPTISITNMHGIGFMLETTLKRS